MRKVLIWLGIAFVMISFMMWFSFNQFYDSRRSSFLNSWTAIQEQILQQTSQTVQGWMESEMKDPGNPLHDLEMTAYKKFIEPFHIIPSGKTWFANQNYFINGSASNTDFSWKPLAVLFTQSNFAGATHLDDLITGISTGSNGSSWYTLSNDIGKEIITWSSFWIGDLSWTIWSSTPEQQILASSELEIVSQREKTAIILITILIWGIYALIIRFEITRQKQVRLLESAVNEQTDLAKCVTEQSAELSLINSELEKASKTKDEFLASMSHELRTPLTTIIGLSSALQTGIYGPVTEKQEIALGTVARNGEHLSNLINDILDLSKIEAGKLKLEIRPINVASLVETCLAFINQQAFNKKIHVETNVDPNAPSFMGDELRVKQALINLLNNAIKFSPEGSGIGLDIKGDFIQQTISFSVWDHRTVITQEDLVKIFKPFVQLDSSLSRSSSGSGLGLSMVANITELHGGSVTVESEPGKGSRFTILLPLNDFIGQSQNNASGSEHLFPPLSERLNLSSKILLVEDNQENSDLISDYLTSVGCHIVIANSADEALHLTRTEKPDLIIMDIQLPDMNGLDAIRLIRTDKKNNTVPIIALTALAMQGDREKCLEAGANEYIKKPFDLNFLLITIKRELEIGQESN